MESPESNFAIRSNRSQELTAAFSGLDTNSLLFGYCHLRTWKTIDGFFFRLSLFRMSVTARYARSLLEENNIYGFLDVVTRKLRKSH